MLGNTIFFKAIDGVDLKGMIYKSEKETKKILISVHGMATNCIKYRDEVIAKEINKLGIDLLVFNNRGHDLINYIKKEEKESEELAGTAFEDVYESYEDILGTIKYVLENNYKEIYIMGHSLGSTKVIYFYNKILENNKNLVEYIKGILLLSLVDIPMSIKIYLKDKYASTVTYAKNMKKEGMENVLMPEYAFIHPMSVKTFLRYTTQNENIDFARFSDQTYDYKELNNIKIPLFMRWGNNGELIIQEANELCNDLKSKIKNEKLNIGYIDGANHGYNEKEEELAKDICDFIKEIN